MNVSFGKPGGDLDRMYGPTWFLDNVAKATGLMDDLQKVFGGNLETVLTDFLTKSVSGKSINKGVTYGTTSLILETSVAYKTNGGDWDAALTAGWDGAWRSAMWGAGMEFVSGTIAP